MIAAVRQDLRYALRTLRRKPGFAIAVILTMPLGIGANTAMFALVHSALLKPPPYADPARLVLGSTTFHGTINPWTSLPDYYDFREQADSFETLAAMGGGPGAVLVTGGERADRVATLAVSTDFFSTLGVAPAAGRPFTADEGKAGAPYVALVSEGYALRRFGSATNAVGQVLTVHSGAPHVLPMRIVGVMPATFRILGDVDLWTPMRRGENDAPATRQFHSWLLVGRLKPGVTLERAQEQVTVIAHRLEREYPDSDRSLGLLLEPLQSGLIRDQARALVVLMAAVGLVLLIACANVAGLLLARGAARRSELAVRAALGASRARIAGQLLVESLLLAAVSGAAGLALAVWLERLLPVVTGLAAAGIAPGVLDRPVLFFALGLTLITGLLFGVAPALRASSVNVADGLAGGGRTTECRRGMALRGALVVGQVAISLVLLIGAGLLIKSFLRMADTNPGFDVQHLLTGGIQLLNADYPDAVRQSRVFDGVRADLAATAGVSAVGFVDRLPIRDPLGNVPVWSADYPPTDPSERRTADFRKVLPGYFDAIRIPLLAGRDIADNDRIDRSPVLVVSELTARALFPDRSPLGQRVLVDFDGTPRPFEVVGVVGDARVDGIGRPPRMAMYASFYQFPTQTMNFVVRTTLPPDTLGETVRRLVEARDRNVFVENLSTMERLIGDSLVSRRVTATTFALFSTTALLLACVGLYGVLAYDVAERAHEIGVRLALGAGGRDVMTHVLMRSAALVGPGLVVGFVVSLWAVRLIGGLLYDVPPIDPATFAMVGACLAAVALVSTALPAWRAARIDPVQVLRSE